MPYDSNQHVNSTTREQIRRQRIGHAIRSRRQEMGWTLITLAEATDTVPSTISRIERGTSTPSYRVLGRLAVALNINESELLAAVRKETQIIEDLNTVLAKYDMPEPARRGVLDLDPYTLAALVQAFRIAAQHPLEAECDRSAEHA